LFHKRPNDLPGLDSIGLIDTDAIAKKSVDEICEIAGIDRKQNTANYNENISDPEP
jgi:hypothetical protein